MMSVQRLTRPAILPVTMPALQAHCRVSTQDGFDDELERLALAATDELESYAQIALLTQRIRLTLEWWPLSNRLLLPVAPLLDGASVTVTADTQPFTSFATVPGLRPAIRLESERPCGLVIIEYDAGFGASASSVPSDLIAAILDQTVTSFDMRGPGDGKSNGMSPHMARIAARYRRVAL